MQSTTRVEKPKKEERYSNEYIIIRKTAENTWPEWKRTTYNVNFATSAHAKKITIK